MNKLYPFLALIVLGFSVSLAYAAPAASGLDKIEAYAGTWKTQTEHFNSPYSKAGKETSTLHNDCWRSGDFYACHQIVNGKSAALIVFTYSGKDGLYHSYAIPANGGDAGLGGELIIKGNIWTFPWDYKDKGKIVYFRVVNIFTAPGAIEYRQEFSNDKTHWTVMAKGHEARVH
ncbi:MAG: hypothetical protein ACRER0_01635 [Gammaproteobacteria bacterium]